MLVIESVKRCIGGVTEESFDSRKEHSLGSLSTASMRIFNSIMAVAVVISLQVTNQMAHIPVTAQLPGQTAQAAGVSTHDLILKTNQPQPLIVKSTLGSFDEAVLIPLRAKQAEAEQKAKANAQKRLVISTASTKSAAPIRVATGDVWEQLRLCEAGGDYAKNTGNGFYGAYQYNLSTWSNYGGFARPDLAPPAMQDAKAQATQAARGWSPWPACARKLGLM